MFYNINILRRGNCLHIFKQIKTTFQCVETFKLWYVTFQLAGSVILPGQVMDL